MSALGPVDWTVFAGRGAGAGQSGAGERRREATTRFTFEDNQNSYSSMVGEAEWAAAAGRSGAIPWAQFLLEGVPAK